MTQQAFGTDDDQRFAKRPDHLPAQQVEHLCRCRRNADLHVVVRAQLQVTLDPRGRVFRSLALVAMRQHQRQSADPAPLDLAGGDELVDHHLRTVAEVPELGFPDHQFVRFRRRISVFETEHRFLRQYRIDYHEVRLVVADVLQRNISSGIPALAVLVMPYRVTMEEGAAATVLSRQAHCETVLEQRSISQVLGHAPVERQCACRHGAAIGDDFFDTGM